MIEASNHALEVDWGRLSVVGPRGAVKLTPKAAAVLRLLLAQPGVTLTRKEILDAVWPGTFSSDDVLTQVIAELRRALDDPAKDSRWIATVPKLGYRWVGATTQGPVAPVRSARQPLAMLVLAAIALIAVVAIVSRRAAVPSAPVAIAAHPLTAEPGPDIDPAISPDGRRIAYVHDARLRVRELDAVRFDELTLGGRPSAPAWSPDGRELAYLSIDGGTCELRAVALETHAVRTIADGCPVAIHGTIDWAPDGSFLVFSREESAGEALGARSVSIHRVAPGGGATTRISNAHRWLVVDGDARVAADSRSVAFVRDGEGRRRVMIAAADGAGEAREVPFERWPYRVAWSGADALIVAAHGTTPAEIWRVGIDGSGAVALAAQGGPGLAVSRDGRLAVFEQRLVDDNVWSVELDRSDAAPRQVTSGTRSELCPRISPDGRTLAYLADDGGALEVTLQDLASGERRRVSHFAPHSPVDLRWSPRGGHLAVVLGTETGKHPALLRADGTAIELPPAIAALRVTQVEWTYDESHLLLGVEREGRRELHRVPFPALDADELVIDRSIGAFASDRGAARIWLSSARDDALESLDARFAATAIDGVRLRAMPGDQWLVRDGVLAEQVQTARGAAAALRYGALGAEVVERNIVAPEPPLGRNFDLGAGRLWYSRRDGDNVDLVALPLN